MRVFCKQRKQYFDFSGRKMRKVVTKCDILVLVNRTPHTAHRTPHTLVHQFSAIHAHGFGDFPFLLFPIAHFSTGIRVFCDCAPCSATRQVRPDFHSRTSRFWWRVFRSAFFGTASGFPLDLPSFCVLFLILSGAYDTEKTGLKKHLFRNQET